MPRALRAVVSAIRWVIGLETNADVIAAERLGYRRSIVVARFKALRVK